MHFFFTESVLTSPNLIFTSAPFSVGGLIGTLMSRRPTNSADGLLDVKPDESPADPIVILSRA